MADEPLTDERLAEIRALLTEVEQARERLHGLMGNPDRPRAPMVVAANELLAEVDRLRAREAAAMAIVMRLAVVEPQDLGDDRYHGGFGYAPEDIDPLIDELSALLAKE